VTFWDFLAPLVAVGFYIFTIISAYCLFAKSSKAVWIVSITYGGSNHFDGVGVVGGRVV
jgi:hypothetical protein